MEKIKLTQTQREKSDREEKKIRRIDPDKCLRYGKHRRKHAEQNRTSAKINMTYLNLR